MDVAWVVRGGADPLPWIEKHGKRIVAVHVKDIAKPGEGLDEDGWSDVGHGTIDWAGLIKALRAKSAGQYFVMEQDNPNDIERFARRSIASVKSLLGAIIMAKKLGVGVIGCGNISKAYFSLAPLFRGIEMRACADINMDAAKARAKEFELRAETVDGPAQADDIDIVVNLTIPAVHYEVSKAGARRRQARLFGKAVRAVASRKGSDLQEAGREEGAAHRLGARHLPRRRAPAGARADRRAASSARSPAAPAMS